MRASLLLLLFASVASSSVTTCGLTSPCSARHEVGARFMRKTNVHPFPRIVYKKDSKCVDATRFDNVVDFTCLFVWSRAFYHRVIDCAVSDYDLFELAQSLDVAHTLLVVPTSIADFVEMLLPSYTAEILPPDADNNKSCVLVARGSSVTYETRNLGSMEEQQARAARFRTRILQSIGPVPVVPYVLFLERRKTREIANEREFLGHLLSALPGRTLRRYYGNESLAETISLFAKAQVVVGFHGAGFANVIFCNPQTVVLEFSLYEDETNTVLWRTNNRVARLHGSVQWIVHALPLTTETIPNWQSLRNSGGAVADKFQGLPAVRIPQAEAAAALNKVKLALGAAV